MAKFVVRKSYTNQSAAPFPLDTLKERLIKDTAVDMRDNYKIMEKDNGYVKVFPIDESKLYK
ncbi:hypothetical protein [Halobacillus sp. KGW1]|uniref:hypothetical protein n=1 Tax=Halobacillus sp. KGW1 TaxID=1793726 RepID=UPI000782B396|nr:hypothetical protein [Halobacillus sp. KGW1]